MSEPDGGNDLQVEDVLRAIADARDEDVTDLPPVWDAMDPEALVVFLRSANVPTTVTVHVYDCRVEITGDGDVTVTPEAA